jgi:hypothetical protein
MNQLLGLQCFKEIDDFTIAIERSRLANINNNSKSLPAPVMQILSTVALKVFYEKMVSEILIKDSGLSELIHQTETFFKSKLEATE